MMGAGYKQNKGDPTLFIKHSYDDKISIVIIYIDDLIIIGDVNQENEALKKKLAKEFKIKVRQTQILFRYRSSSI